MSGKHEGTFYVIVHRNNKIYTRPTYYRFMSLYNGAEGAWTTKRALAEDNGEKHATLIKLELGLATASEVDEALGLEG